MFGRSAAIAAAPAIIANTTLATRRIATMRITGSR